MFGFNFHFYALTFAELSKLIFLIYLKGLVAYDLGRFCHLKLKSLEICGIAEQTHAGATLPLRVVFVLNTVAQMLHIYLLYSPFRCVA